MLGALFALISAASFGLNSASVRRGVITSSVFQALAITVPIGLPLFFIVAFAAGEAAAVFTFDAMAYLWLSLAGIFHFVWGRYCAYRAVKAIGANLAGPVQQVNLIMALGLAILWLGETLTPLRVLGLILVFVGPAVMVMGRRKKAEREKKEAAAKTNPGDEKKGEEKFEPKYVEGYVFASLTATGYGLSPIFVKLGLQNSDSSLAAGLVSYMAATAFFCLLLIPKGRLSNVIYMDRKAIPWFVISGIFVGIAQIFRYMALAIAPVSVVSPIQRTSVVFRTLFSTLLNRDHELLDARIIIGMVLSLLGAVALGISIDLVAPYVPLPQEFMEWRWP